MYVCVCGADCNCVAVKCDAQHGVVYIPPPRWIFRHRIVDEEEEAKRDSLGPLGNTTGEGLKGRGPDDLAFVRQEVGQPSE